MKVQVPPIKCQGIKTKLVPWIADSIDLPRSSTWIEPFMGSGVVAFNVKPPKAILADSNPHLIQFYQQIKDHLITPNKARHFLETEGSILLETEGAYYYDVRNRFNSEKRSLDFLFLNRSCFNGMMRFNKKGGFNVPFCRKPNRFRSAYITKICNQIQSIQDIIDAGDYTFVCQDYKSTLAQASESDTIYCDPPYMGRHVDYFNSWDDQSERMLNRILTQSGLRFALSTWHSNAHRSNKYLDKLWSEYEVLTRDHYYHVGAKETNRGSVLEALVVSI